MESDKKSIIFGVNDFLVGGMQRQFIEQLKFFDKSKFEISLITLFQFSNTPNLHVGLPKDLKIYKLNFKGFKDIKSWWELYKLIRKIKPDIVVSSLFFSNTVFRILKPFVGYVSIAREHNTYTDKTFFQKKIDKILSFSSKHIVAVSKTVADFTSKQEKISRNKFVVIHNGIDIESVQKKLENLPSKSNLKKELGFGVDDKLLLNISRLVPQKNHKLLIESFSLFSKNNPEYKLVIVGGGPLMDDLKECLKLKNLENNVFFLGLKYDVWKFYKMSDIFVSMSKIEGMSNTYLEALSANIPIIATKTAGTDEIIKEGENGFFIDFNESSFFEKMQMLKSSNILNNNISHTINNFDIRDTVRKYELLFK